MSSFNSLSRDHRNLAQGDADGPGRGLSTPSLGITNSLNEWHANRGERPRVCFQLPLSGSRGSGCLTSTYYHTFNSLSRDHSSSPRASRPAMRLSTPSLGITEPIDKGLPCAHVRRFQLPLSGSPRRTVGESRFLPWHFQLPLSGSHPNFVRVNVKNTERTFNSLSRDHRARFRDFSALRGFLPRHPFAQMISKTTIWIYRFAPL